MAVNGFSDLLPFMLPELPGCTTPMITQALQRGLRQFCIDTEAWYENTIKKSLVADQSDYILYPTWDADIVRIKELRINDATNIATGNDGVAQSESMYEFVPPYTIRLDDAITPSEAVTNGLEVDLRILPSINATTVDPAFLTLWSEPIIGWAMWYLMSMERKKWSSPNRSAFYGLQYQKGRSKAKSEKVRLGRGGSFSLTA
jgi:hypothetical protein